MSLTAIPNPEALGNHKLLASVLKELQNLNIDVVDGAAAGTKMNIAAMRPGDTIKQAIVLADTWAPPVSDLANLTIQDTKASGTITVSGNPAADDTVTVNGVVYTWKAPGNLTQKNHVKITTGDNNAMAASLAAAINVYENRYESQLNGDAQRVAKVIATAASNVVTVKSLADGTAGNSYTLAKSGSNVTVSGSGTLSGGTATGGIKSTTDLSAATLLVIWYKKP